MNRIFTFLFIIVFASLQPIASKSQAVKVADSLALVDLYNSTGGPTNWISRDNWLTGPVSTWFGITVAANGDVTGINLNQNQLTGKIPASIGKLKDLTELILSDSYFNGTTIPSTIGNITALKVLDLNNGFLVGFIPSTIGNLTNLQQLILYSNNFSGSIPSEIGNCTNLEILNLSFDKLSGSLPDEIGNLINLQQLLLEEDKLSGSLPASLGNLTKLNALDLIYNQITGPLPASLGNLVNLESFYLADNQVTGEIPVSFGNMANLQRLALSNNMLSGSIPMQLLNAPKLTEIGLDNNLFSADVDTSLYVYNPAKGNITLGLTYNYFNYTPLEKLHGLQGVNTKYIPQYTKAKLHNNAGTLSISTGGTLSNNEYNWFDASGFIKTISGDSTFTPGYGGNFHVVVYSDVLGFRFRSDTVKVDGALPVRVINFTGKIIHGTTLLNWQTATEVNTAYFNVERSLDGLHFTTVGTVRAAGNSTVAKNYDFSDAYPANQNIIYYRLTEVDKDGKHWRTNTIKLSTNAEAKVPVIWPNPVTNTLTLKWAGAPTEATYIITSIEGKQLLMQKQTASAQVKLNTQQLAAGTYILTILTADGQKHSLKFVKE